ncbi:response regulator transcription factor [Clostridium botulinum]|uniref:response regulator transcription factor n=1 Tax=Clostridium TaxID=1485 RepID=UPI0002FF7CE4|nr:MULTISPECIES: response regulator transcription factor [Clostridium]MBN1067616.1 DNA-binding response regulator [Clostridium botulinum]MBZ9691207.1 response regulator transcription factor [Clostridium sp. M14]NFI95863.1 response regulator transcription factor [Clostridium botulinum]NFN93251.1 response regulator transcription factor [Clostridium botulinum]NFO91610.1 response regulator transcription factor [Clostridium botulinum]
MFNVLIIDDEVEIVELIEVYLVNEGYKVFKAYNGSDGINIINEEKIHLVVLDVMMPGIDGFQVCMKIRKDYNIPIIMLSAKSQDVDKIQGLSTGADDYMIKPFNPMELIARVKSQIRRYVFLNEKSNKSNDIDIIEFKDITINKKNHKVLFLGKELKLTPIEYEILLLLANNLGTVFSAEDIFKEVWKEKYFEGNNTVMVHIWRLREKIEENPKEPKIIETVWGVGYKIEE